MNIQELALKKNNAIVGDVFNPNYDKDNASNIQVEAMQLGFIFTEDALAILTKHPDLYRFTMNSLASIIGADFNWQPFYPNFPRQVYQISQTELFWNSVFHYLTLGEWTPQYEKEERLPSFEGEDFKVIDVISLRDFYDNLTSILSSNGSLTNLDHEVLDYIINDIMDDDELYNLIPERIPFKETMAHFVGLLRMRGVEISFIQKFVNTTTDVLRIAAFLSGGDPSMPDQTKFSLKRKDRKFILNLLESVIREEDIARDKQTWIRLFHNLHVGEYKKRFPKSYSVAQKLRNTNKIRSFNSKIEHLLEKGHLDELMEELIGRPGEFARRLDHLLRMFESDQDIQDIILEKFSKCAYRVDMKVLVQLMDHFYNRDKVDQRIILPKGNVNKSYFIDANAPLSKEVIDETLHYLEDAIMQKISNIQLFDCYEYDAIFIDPVLYDIPCPIKMRNANDSLLTLPRGAELALKTNKNNRVLRMFVHWQKPRDEYSTYDIDLSAAMLDENFQMIDQLSYYDLRSEYGVHSGDFRDARYEACEFIDIDIDHFKQKGRYVMMDIRVYSGPKFEDQKTVAGWMIRNAIKHNEGNQPVLYDPSSVKEKFSITNAKKNCIPVLFDIESNKAIWIDIEGSSKKMIGGNNLESNKANISDITRYFATRNFYSIGDLLGLYGLSIGKTILHEYEEEVKTYSFTKEEWGYDHNKILSTFF